MELALSIVACLASISALVVAIVRGNALKESAKAHAKDDLGKRYASLAWAYAKAQADSSDPVKARRHAVEAFVLADTSADGKRDFTDKQVGAYVDACR